MLAGSTHLPKLWAVLSAVDARARVHFFLDAIDRKVADDECREEDGHSLGLVEGPHFVLVRQILGSHGSFCSLS